MSSVLSDESPSMTMYSRFGYPWESTDLIVSSMNSPWLRDGVMMLILGEGDESCLLMDIRTVYQPVNYNVDVLFTFQHKHPEG